MGIINGINEKEKRRLLRRQQTPQEEKLWHMLRGSKTGIKWKRQVSIGKYVADFYCSSRKLVIELDGIQHSIDKFKEYDHVRDEYFRSLGIIIIRISNHDFNQDDEIVLWEIKKYAS